MRPLAIASVLVLAAPTLADGLSAADKAAGWVSLFDGDDVDAWRGYRQEGFPQKGWEVVDGTLHVIGGGGGGDIISREQYGDFELEFEFKVGPKSNSGVIFRVTERHGATWQTGPEFQVLDDVGYGVDPLEPHAAGALYDLVSPSGNKVSKPAGEWNQGRIRLHDGLLQHWLNGVKTVEIRTDGHEWRELIAWSKFRGYEGFGVEPRGHIALQEHGDNVWYRSIRVRDLDAPLPGEVRLFNGSDLTGWKAVVPDLAAQSQDQSAPWRIQDGVLVCSGNPAGYIRTTDRFTNYVLKFEWRFNPVTKKPGNSGALLRVQEPDMVWPRSIEAQLMSGNAGDFWNIEAFTMKTDAARLNGRNTKKTHGAEFAIGEWNEYEIIVAGGDVTLKVNGEVVNHAWDAEEIAGFIALQSEGAEIHFRNIRLAPIN